MRRGIALAAAALAALLLASCASLPSSGGVNAGSPGTGDEALELDLQAPSPTEGASQEEILRGFINAATSPRSNYAVARQYLAPEFADEWQPGEGATIDRFADRDTVRVNDGELRIDAVPAAELAANGQYQAAQSQAPIQLDYRFARVGGEWRISEAPAGVLMDESNFSRVYRTHTLYYYDRDFRFAVPDVRWFAGRESVQTSIVRALLAGPADWLDAGVVSAFPEGVRLDPDAVPIDGGIADVSLEGVPADDELASQRMRFQLKESLASVPNVDDVQLSLDGTVQGGALTFAAVTDPVGDSRPVVYDGTTFGRLVANGGGIEPIPGLSDQVAALLPTAAALAPEAQSAAVRSVEGDVYRVRPDEQPVRVDDRDGLIAPAIDGQGYIWTVPAGAAREIRATGTDGTTVALTPPWTANTIASMELSPDGTRLVALLDDGTGSRFVAVSVGRTAAGAPQSIGSVQLVLAGEAGAAEDVSWLDQTTVASLTSAEGGSAIVSQVLGGLATRRDGPAGGVQIDAAASPREYRVLTTAGELETVSGVGWQVRAGDLRFLGTQLAG
ncbi:LpqB family beta-propeller domain-containing protein [Agromyces mediolanus]|uniref:LpqB family beta-propeller domain-containing protein n=1 Tax=Agromyces mediolanus TaxID=41986 RepID=UPI00203F30A5|nr:LpqB family beta-propeller domain-containing protein [Agromyces mediolanus]MCM3656570.1 LpqB family beta-propeller domain-containing protein [Agromyces mediolanus]